MASAGAEEAGFGGNPRVLLVVSLVTLLVVLTVRGSVLQVFEGRLLDPDGFMWLARVLELQATGDFWDGRLPRVDPPHGYEQHWTRPFDVVLLIGAWVGSLFVDFDRALLGWSIVLGPLFAVATVVILRWSFDPLLPRSTTALLGFLFVSQQSLISIYQFGRPDHHLLHVLLFAALCGYVIRMQLRPASAVQGVIAGSIAGGMIWLGTEGMLAILAVMAVLGLPWLTGGEDFGRKSLHFCGGLTVFCIAALLIEHGPAGLLQDHYDELGRAHVLAFSLVSGFWLAVVALEGRAALSSVVRRAILTVFGVVLVYALLRAATPDLLVNPYMGTDPYFDRLFWPSVTESHPPVKPQLLLAGAYGKAANAFWIWLGIVVPAMPALWLLLRKADRAQTRAWLAIALIAAVFLTLAFTQRRFCRYVSILLLPCYAYTLCWCAVELRRRVADWAAAPVCWSMLVLAVFLFLSPRILFGQAASEILERRPALQRSTAEFAAFCAFLNDPSGLGARTERVLISAEWGPEILFRTRHAIFSVPSHRYHPGFADAVKILSALDDETARALIEARNVDLIVVERSDGSGRYTEHPSPDASIFYRRLYRGQLPEWIEPVPLPAPLRRSFKLLRVQRAAAG